MKDTRLNEDAAIYSKREPKSEKEKWSTLSRSDKIQYFKDYYLKVVIVTIVVAVVLFQLIYTIFSPKPDTALNLTIVNAYMDEESTDALAAELADYLVIDLENQEIFIDTSLYISNDDFSEITVASEQKLSVYAASGEIDLLIADRELFQRYAQNGFFVNLAEALPSNLYSRVGNDLFMAAAEDVDTEEVPYGFSISGYERFDSLKTMTKDPVIGILINSKNSENALSVIEWLVEE